MIRVLVADDHPLYRDALARIVRQSVRCELLAEVAGGSAVMPAITRLTPDVAVLDPTMAGLDIGRLLQGTARRGVQTKVILLAGPLPSGEPYAALRFGAVAYLSKHATADEVVRAILRAADGQATIGTDVQTQLMTQLQAHEAPVPRILSARERQVLERIADGRTARQIAEEFVVTLSTVRTHQRRVCDKLGVPSQAAAVAAGIRLGLLD
jgi:two-component system nitrate/nitrite response regulator NarL